jgi:CRISPR type IV-associated protein Csf2
MSHTNRIQGVLRLTSPMHCATPDSSSDTADNKNVTKTHKTVVVTANGSQRIPYFPSNDLRGRLRRKAATLVLDYITANGRVKLELYAGLMAGAIDASPESAITVEEALRARDNVYMGLFGGGTRLLRSRYCTNDLIPVLRDTIDAGIVPASFGEAWVPQGQIAAGVTGNLTGYHLVETRTSFRIDDVSRVMNASEMEKFIDDALVSVAEKQAETLGGRAERKADKDAAKLAKSVGDKVGEIATKKDLGNMFAVESIARGTPMYCLIDLANDVSDIHVGLMLLSLQSLVREQALGGWIRAGMGRYDADLTLTRNGQTYPVFAPGQNGADATLTDDVFRAFCAPAQEAMQKLTAQEMMEFFTPRTLDKEEAKAKKAASKAKADEDKKVAA